MLHWKNYESDVSDWCLAHLFKKKTIGPYKNKIDPERPKTSPSAFLKWMQSSITTTCHTFNAIYTSWCRKLCVRPETLTVSAKCRSSCCKEHKPILVFICSYLTFSVTLLPSNFQLLCHNSLIIVIFRLIHIHTNY